MYCLLWVLGVLQHGHSKEPPPPRYYSLPLRPNRFRNMRIVQPGHDRHHRCTAMYKVYVEGQFPVTGVVRHYFDYVPYKFTHVYLVQFHVVVVLYCRILDPV